MLKGFVSFLLLAITLRADTEVTSPGLFDHPTPGRVLAITSPELALQPFASGRFLRFYAERVGDDSAVQLFICLAVDASGVSSITDFNSLLDEKNKERPVRVLLGGGRSAYATARMSVEELREAVQREPIFTFRGKSSQVDVRVSSELASNFLATCEQTFGTLTNAVPIRFKPVSGELYKSRLPGRLSLSVESGAFGDYDAAFIAAVELHWKQLLEEHRKTRLGKVVIDFRLTQDGRITDLKVTENDVGEILGMLCQSAILDPAPYPKPPPQMRRAFKDGNREMRLTFHYN